MSNNYQTEASIENIIGDNKINYSQWYPNNQPIDIGSDLPSVTNHKWSQKPNIHQRNRVRELHNQLITDTT